MQASKIELHHKVYAIQFPDHIRRVIDGKNVYVPAGLWRGVVSRILTDRHENGPKGMTQRATIDIKDNNFDFPNKRVEQCDLAWIVGDWQEHSELIERQAIEKKERHHAEWQMQCRLALLNVLFDKCLMTKTAERMRRSRTRATHYMEQPSIAAEDIEKLIAKLSMAFGPIHPDQVDLPPEPE